MFSKLWKVRWKSTVNMLNPYHLLILPEEITVGVCDYWNALTAELCSVRCLLPSELGTRSLTWLRNNVASWKVAGSFPDEIIGIFGRCNPCSRILAVGSTRPLTEMSTKKIPGVKWRPAPKADSLTAICEPIVWIMWELRRLKTPWPVNF
jgi:hypothetical protein